MPKQNILAMIIADLTKLKDFAEIQTQLLEVESIPKDKALGIIKTFLDISNQNAQKLKNDDANFAGDESIFNLPLPDENNDELIRQYVRMIANICEPSFISLVTAVAQNAPHETIIEKIRTCKNPCNTLFAEESLITIFIDLNQNDNLAFLLRYVSKRFPQEFFNLINLQGHIFKKGTPLHLAIQLENLSSVENLLKYGANPNKPSSISDWDAPLYTAIMIANHKMVMLLLSYGAKFITYYGIPYLYWAIHNTDAIVLEILKQDIQFRTEMEYYRHRNKLTVDAKNQTETMILSHIAFNVSGIKRFETKEPGILHKLPDVTVPKTWTPEMLKKIQQDAKQFLKDQIVAPIIARHAAKEPYMSIKAYVKPSDNSQFPTSILSLICEYKYASFDMNVNLSTPHRSISIEPTCHLRQFHLHNDRFSALPNNTVIVGQSKAIAHKTKDAKQLAELNALFQPTLIKIYQSYSTILDMLNLYELAYHQTPKDQVLYFNILLTSLAWLKHASAEAENLKPEFLKGFLDEIVQNIPKFIAIQKALYDELCQWDNRYFPLNLKIQIALLSFSTTMLQKIIDQKSDLEIFKTYKVQLNKIIFSTVHNLKVHLQMYTSYEYDSFESLSSVLDNIETLHENLFIWGIENIDSQALKETVDKLNKLLDQNGKLGFSPNAFELYEDFIKAMKENGNNSNSNLAKM